MRPLKLNLIIAIFLFTCVAVGQEKLPVIKANSAKVTIEDGADIRKDWWTLAPDAKPDVFETAVRKGKTKKITFVTDVDKISFDVEAGKTYDFIIQWNGKDCYTQIKATELLFWSDPKFWETGALKTPYKPNISDEEKIAGLSKFWSEVKYNLINFPADVDWDKTYMEFIPKVLATKSTLEYYKVLTRFCALLKDGHTNVYMPGELNKEVFGRPGIATRLVEDKVIIIRVLDERLKAEGLAAGQEIVEIDGVPAKKYGEDIVAPYQSASTKHDLDARTYQYQLLNGPVGKSINMVMKGADGKTFSRVVPRLGIEERGKMVPPRIPLEFKMLPGNIAHVKVNSMEGPDKTDQLFIQKYDEIIKSDALILDLRDNGGGDSDVGYRILSHLTDQPFKGSKWFTRNYRPSYRAWGRPQEKFGEDATGYSAADTVTIRNGRPLYAKPVIVLSSPRTFSAAEDFLVAFKPLKRGLIIGEPSGGSTGQPMFMTLPGGGSARVCTKRDTFADGTEFVGVGVIPDILAYPKVADFSEGKDSVLEIALKELKKR